MAHQSKADIIRRYFSAYEAKDRKTVEALLTDDFRFTSPYDDAIDKATYFARCWPNSDWIKTFNFERIVEDQDNAFVLYEIVTSGTKRFRNTEFFTFEGDRVRSVNVYFGATYENDVFVPQNKPTN